MKKLTYFCSTDPDNYSAQDNMKHLYFKDYKHLKDVDFVVDTEPLAVKILASMGLFIVLLVLLFI
jgi:hypothetical protein